MLNLVVNYSERIDKYIANNSDISRNDIKVLIDEGYVFVNDKQITKCSFVVKEEDNIQITKLLDKKMHLEGQNIALDIVYECDDYIIINKPSGMVVHPAPGHKESTLVNALMYRFENNLSNVNGTLRLGIVHRIDKDTSGLLIVAKNNETHNYLAKLLKEHKIQRTYYAICDGKIENKFINLELPIGRDSKDRKKYCVTETNSKYAFTSIEVKDYILIDGKIKTFIKCNLKTGRTHQIRVHLAYIKHPVYGDPIYNKEIDAFGQRLHAGELRFIDSKGVEQTFISPLPKKFQEDLKNKI
ncbi:RluA family pseudouridine synthase [Metamycoplasma hyosynoviae]|uniref:RluA family pseudouridine synthase n=1 Tax=Metamycoplasma hyosynoviae TaxID=29559 RepID=UPI0023629AB8|nr:RluA family pseudouridine synthase [Metamycoplasma hyosynoviae]MDD1377602.1 RluA family pseudouridine synthase [Metamycoplasma hyosynoviae]